MTKAPDISVIMTVYDGDRDVAEAIRSIQRQSFDNFEFVIVDDGSKDRTREILGRARADARIIVLTRGRIGRARALNLAWQTARGEFIANIDADDLAEPSRLERQVAYLRDHREVGLLGTAVRVVHEETGEERIHTYPARDGELRDNLVRGNPFCHSSVMMPRAVLAELNGYNERYEVCIDYELWVRIAERYRLANLADVLTVKRKNANAYFRYRISGWKRMVSTTAIRWRAWHNLSGKSSTLHFVLHDHLEKWLYRWGKRRQ